MNEVTARFYLRTIALITILIGAILTTMSVVAAIGARSAIPPGSFGGMTVEFEGMFGNITLASILAQLSAVGWGLLLHALTPTLARKMLD